MFVLNSRLIAQLTPTLQLGLRGANALAQNNWQPVGGRLESQQQTWHAASTERLHASWKVWLYLFQPHRANKMGPSFLSSSNQRGKDGPLPSPTSAPVHARYLSSSSPM